MLLICGVIAGPLFTAAWIVEGATRADYSSIRHPISSLAIGEWGWTQAANFVVTGLLTFAFALGLRRASRLRGVSAWGPALVAAVSVGFLGAGLFTTAPLNGYPLGTPDLPTHYGVVGRLHRLFSSLVFLGLPAACFVFGRNFARRGERTWAVYSRATGMAFVMMFVVTSAGFAQVRVLVDYAGLFQRVTLTTGWIWLTLLAVYILNVSSSTGTGDSAAAGAAR